MSGIKVYTTQACPYCVRAKQLLDQKNATYDEIRVDLDPQQRIEMMEKSRRRTVPQIWIGDRHIGGFDELWALDRAGQLDPLLQDVQ